MTEIAAPLLRCESPSSSGCIFAPGNLEIRGRHALLVGSWDPLFRLLSGELELEHGRLEVAGVAVSGAVATGRVGLVLRSPVVPPRWSVRDTLLASARLAGLSGAPLRTRVGEVTEEFGLGSMQRRRGAALSRGEDRAVAIAAACLTEPLALAICDPLDELSSEDRSFLVPVLDRAMARAATLVSAARMPGHREQAILARKVDEVVVAQASGVVARAHRDWLVSGVRAYRVVVSRHLERFAEQLGLGGFEVHWTGGGEVRSAMVIGDPKRLGTGPLIERSLAVGAPLLEMVPLELEQASGSTGTGSDPGR